MIDLTTATRDEVFTYSVDYMRKQGCRSIIKDDVGARLKPAYFGPDGTRCGVGCFLPKECLSWGVKQWNSVRFCDLPHNIERFLQAHKFGDIYQALQTLHDFGDNWNNDGSLKRNEALKVAQELGVEYVWEEEGDILKEVF